MTLSLRNILIFCVMVLGSLILLLPIIPRRTSPYEAALYTALVGTSPAAPPPALTSEAALIYDPLHNNILFEKQGDAVFGIASITKIMTALVALEHVGENEIIEVSEDAVGIEGNEGELRIGEHFLLRDLIVIMITTSSNDAATAMAEHVGKLYGATTFEESQKLFVRMMNNKANHLGLRNTHFENSTGLDIDEKAGIISNSSTAKDIAQLVAHMFQHPLLQSANIVSTILTSEEGIPHAISTTHILLAEEPGIRGGKTGFTDSAGSVLATVAEVPLGELSIMVVLGSTRDNRFKDTQLLLDWLRTQ